MIAGGVVSMGNVLPLLALFGGGPLLVWWLRRGRHAPGDVVRVSSRTALTRNAVISVIETHGRRLLVGATDQGITVLAELDSDREETTPGPQQDAASERGPGMSPLERLRISTVRQPTRPRPPRVHRS